MEVYAHDWIKNKKYVTQLQTLIVYWFKFYPFPPPYSHRPMLVLYSVFFLPENNINTYVYVMSFPRANIGRGGGEKI